MIIVDDACNLQKGTASKEKQAYRNLERYLVFLNAREELIEQNLDNTESVEFSLWSMSGIEFSEIRQSLDEKRFASLPVFVKHAVLNHIEEEKPKTQEEIQIQISRISKIARISRMIYIGVLWHTQRSTAT